MKLSAALLLCAGLLPAGIVSDVRSAIEANNWAAAEQRLAAHRKQYGTTPETLEAMSWLGRGALAAKRFDDAERYASETRSLALALLKTRKLDTERHLPLALGAAIEVHANVLAARGHKAEAAEFLQAQFREWRSTSIAPRIRKNLNLLTLVGHEAPPIETTEWLGTRPQPLATLRGKPVLLFFWAHWCGDCKGEAPVIAEVARRHGIAVIAPTQRYGYAARGEDATPEQEKVYIDAVRRQFYAQFASVPLSEESFRVYGASTTPTLVLIDRAGIVRMFHPGAMPLEELSAAVENVLRPKGER